MAQSLTCTMAARSSWLPQLEAPPELLQHGAVWHVIILLPHDGLVHLRVKWVARARHGLHSQRPEGLHHLLVHTLRTIAASAVWPWKALLSAIVRQKLGCATQVTVILMVMKRYERWPTGAQSALLLH